MKYADVKNDLPAVSRTLQRPSVVNTSDDMEWLALRVLHAIAGELDSISYALRQIADSKTKKRKGRKS